LPDLAERIQVGLLNIMEERDVQIRGYKIRLPLDVFVVASANPEDYTNRGRIVTPLKDRFGSEIRTHYPRTIEHEITIIEQESNHYKDEGIEIFIPRFMKEIVAEITHEARRSPDISQRSGVSARVSISNYENLVSNAMRRAIRLGEKAAAPRISDLPAIISSTAGKIELETIGDNKEERVVEKLVQRAIVNTFNRYFSVGEFEQLLRGFDSGLNMESSELMPSMEYVHQAAEVEDFKKAVTKLQAQGSPVAVASAVEFMLEGLHLNRKLNKDRGEGKTRYRR
jgi:magnesium chelatase subunit I